MGADDFFANTSIRARKIVAVNIVNNKTNSKWFTKLL